MKAKLFFITGCLMAGIFLNGCNTEKTVTIKNSDPDTLFARSQVLLKKEMPAAKFDINANERIIKVSETQNIDYPSYIEMRFAKKRADTEVTVIISEENPERIQNLRYLLTKGLQGGTQQINLRQVDPQNRPKDRVRKGYPARSPRDKRLDRNNDGWVSPMEAQMKPRKPRY